MTAISVGILLYDGCDLLDAVGPYEALLTANRLAVRRGEAAPFAVRTIGRAAAPLHGYGGLVVTPATAAGDVDHLDVLIVPGTIAVDAALDDVELLAAVDALAARSSTVTSVCTGSFLLAATGRLRGRPATTHHEDLAALGAREDVGRAVAGVRWVDDGTVVTGGGIASALAFGLHLVDRYVGRTAAIEAARQLEHPWDAAGADGVPPRDEDHT